MSRMIVGFLVVGVALSSIVSAAEKAPAIKVVASTPASVAKGKAAYAVNCAACHGDKLDADSPAAAVMNPKPRNLLKDAFKAGEDPASVFKTITNGLKIDGKDSTMIAFGHLSEEDRWGLTHYLISVRPAPAKKAKK